MLGTIWPDHELKPYHDDMLVVRLRPTAVAVSGQLSGATTLLRGEAPGLAALHRYDQEGLLHHVVPLGPTPRRATRSLGGRNIPLLLAAAARDRDESRSHSGTLLVRLRHAKHRHHLKRSLAADHHIESVERVPARYVWASPNISKELEAFLPAIRGWNHRTIHLDAARRLKGFHEARGVRVAVIDSGVDTRHPDLIGRVGDYVHGYGGGHPIETSPRDVVGHGTHVTGIIAGRTQRALKIGGICETEVTVYKVFQDVPDYSPAPGATMYMVDPTLYRMALEHCLETDLNVVNLSLAGPAPPERHEAAIFKALLARGTTIVAAMGNAFTDRGTPAYPAATPGVIAVGAIGPNRKVAPFSRLGPHIALCAPGVTIWSTLPRYKGEFGFQVPVTSGRAKAKGAPLSRNMRYDAWPGTSMACPHVTAAVALLVANRGPLTPKQIRKRLMRTADKLPGMKGKEWDYKHGAGCLNLHKLLAR